MNKLLRDSKNRDYQSGNQTQLNEERNSPFFMRLEGPLQFFQSRFSFLFSDSKTTIAKLSKNIRPSSHNSDFYYNKYIKKYDRERRCKKSSRSYWK